MFKRIFLAGVATVMVAGSFLAASQHSGAQETPEPAVAAATMPLTISVSGSGTAYAAPDIAYVSLGVEIMNADVRAAVDDANARMEAIRAALAELGIPDADIRTENFNIYRETFYGPEGPTGEGQFRVNNAFRVTVRDINNVATVLTTALEAGANSVGGVMFDIDDRDAVESEARALAVEDARKVANELAALMGVSVGEVVSISEGTVPVTPFFDNYGGMGGAVAQDMSNVPVEAGSLAVNVGVNITFELVR